MRLLPTSDQLSPPAQKLEKNSETSNKDVSPRRQESRPCPDDKETTSDPGLSLKNIPSSPPNLAGNNNNDISSNNNNDTGDRAIVHRKRRRRIRCHDCAGCLASDCGKCEYCKDKPKFGGPGRKRQACVHRKCKKLLDESGSLTKFSHASPPSKSIISIVSTPKTNSIITSARRQGEKSKKMPKRKRSIDFQKNLNKRKNKAKKNNAHQGKQRSNNPSEENYLLYHQIAIVSSRLEQVYGNAGPGMFPWKTSVLGTVIGLVCAQNTTNSFSAIMYNNLISLCPDPTGNEADWERLSHKSPADLQVALSHGPFYRLKSRIILKLLNRVRVEIGAVTLEPLLDPKVWPDERVRSFLMSFTGIGAKTTSCIMLYRLQRLDFAVDTNILKIGCRLGWFASLGITPDQALPNIARKEIAIRSQNIVRTQQSHSSKVRSPGSNNVDAAGVSAVQHDQEHLAPENSIATDIENLSARIYGKQNSTSSEYPHALRIRKKSKVNALAASPPLKRHAKIVQAYVQKCLKRHKHSFHKWSVLYQAHLRLIAHGEVFCHSRRPLCGTCPLSSMCSFAKTYPSYLKNPPNNSVAELSCTLSVHRVLSTVAITYGGVQRPVEPYMCNPDEVAEAASWGGKFDSRLVQMVMHVISRRENMVEGRLFISPWLAFQGVFPMRGTYFLQNELFEVEGMCQAPASALSAEPSIVHLARSMPVIFRPRPMAHVSRIFRSGFVCGRRFKFPRQLRSYGKHFQGRLAHSANAYELAQRQGITQCDHQDIIDAMNRMIHILENKKREEDWKRTRHSRKKSNSPTKRKSAKTKNKGWIQRQTQVNLTEKQILETDPKQNTLIHVKNIQIHRIIMQFCREMVLGLANFVVSGCCGGLICSCFQFDSMSVCTIQCGKCMIKYHLKCAGLSEEEAILIEKKGMNLHRGIFICSFCRIKDQTTVMNIREPNTKQADESISLSESVSDVSAMGLEEDIESFDDWLNLHYSTRRKAWENESTARREISRQSHASKISVLSNKKRVRRKRCKVCSACVRDSDCGECKYCIDKVKFGGPGRQKQACILRKCLQPVLPNTSYISSRTASSASIASSSSSDSNGSDTSSINEFSGSSFTPDALDANIISQTGFTPSNFTQVGWWMKEAHAIGLTKSIRSTRLKALIRRSIEKCLSSDIISLNESVLASHQELRKLQKYVNRISFLEWAQVHNSTSDLPLIRGNAQKHHFLVRLNEEMVIIAEDNALKKSSGKQSDGKHSKNKVKKSGGSHQGHTDFLIDIDHNVISEMYPALCRKYESSRGMKEIHDVLQMSEWDSVRADECLMRRGSLRSIKSDASTKSSSAIFSSPKSWQCRDCTFINSAVEIKCTLCDCPSTILPPCSEYTQSYISHVLVATRNAEIESQCFICHDGGELITCSVRNCRKVYHPVCAGLDPTQIQRLRKQKWYCPRHYCDPCNRGTGKKWVPADGGECFLCPTSSRCLEHASWIPYFDVDLGSGVGIRALCNSCKVQWSKTN